MFLGLIISSYLKFNKFVLIVFPAYVRVRNKRTKVSIFNKRTRQFPFFYKSIANVCSAIARL